MQEGQTTCTAESEARGGSKAHDGTDRDGTDRDGTGDRDAMSDVSHTNPYTGSTLDDVFRRGPAVADGGVGEPGSGRSAGSSLTEDDTMADVDHTPEHGRVNDVWVRGGRGSAASSGPGEDV